MRHATFIAFVSLSACFSESEFHLVGDGTSDGSGDETGAASVTTSTSASSTSVATTAGTGSGTGSGSSESSGENGSSDVGASETSDGGSSSSTGEADDPYGPCWPGEPAGGSQCAPGAHGTFCVSDDDPAMTGYACTAECESALDCPAPLSGTALPACVDIGDVGLCILDCEQDGDCPAPMVCSVFASGALDPWPAACVWPWGWWE